MDIYSSEMLQHTVAAPLVKKVTVDANNYVIYMGWHNPNDITKCMIRKVSYVKDGNTENWETTYPNGKKDAEYDWADVETLTYNYAK